MVVILKVFLFIYFTLPFVSSFFSNALVSNFKYIEYKSLKNTTIFQDYVEIGNQIKYHSADELVLFEDNLCKKRSDISSKNMFFALAAPSFYGKTQIAFALSKKLPIYFTMDENPENSQDIYLCFHSLNEKLKECAEHDIEMLTSSGIGRDILKNFSSVTFLIHSCYNFKMYTLGFLQALMLEADANFVHGNGSEWMEFYAKRSDQGRSELEIEPVSFYDFINRSDYQNFKDKYLVFLDEFGPKHWVIFIRNVLRAVEMTTVAASTDSRVTNIIGVKSAEKSRGKDAVYWANVQLKLPSANIEFLYQKYNLSEACDKLVSKAKNISEDEAERMLKFLNFLKTDQLPSHRPGLSSKICEIISQTSHEEEFRLSVDALLLIICSELKSYIIATKTNIVDTKDGRVASCALLLGNFYSDQINESSSFPDPSPTFINNHLFHLVNPVCSKDPNFQLHLLSNGELYIKILRQFKQMYFASYFKKEELILILACMIIDLTKPTSSVLSSFSHRVSHFDIESQQNPNAKIRSGASLEVYAAVAIINSSHFSGNRLGILTGLTGVEFFRNLLRNLMFTDINVDRVTIIDSPESGRALEYLESLKVPFLFPTNTEVPSAISEFFPINSDKEGSCRFGSFFRTSNESRIDGKFDIIDSKNVPDIAVVEVKNYASGVPSTLYSDALNNAKLLHPDAKLHIFLTSVFNCPKHLSSGQIKTLQSLGWNAYMIKRQPSNENGLIFKVKKLFEHDTDTHVKGISVILESEAQLEHGMSDFM